MASVHDVAAYILARAGKMTAMKLEKLVYYCQAWSLVWDEKSLFRERIEAWANGPVVPGLYFRHRGKFEVKDWDGDPSALSDKQRATIDGVVDFYEKLSSQQLSDLTHREDPWRNARVGLAAGERGKVEISRASMHEYYGSL